MRVLVLAEAPPRLDRRRARAGALALAIAAGLTVAPSASALPADGNGNYTQILCANPASQQGVGVSGMPEGLTNPASTDTWQITSSRVNCTSGPMTSSGGVPMAVGYGATYPQGTWSALLYQAPANITINGGTIYRAEKAEGANSGFMGIIQQGGEYDVLYSLPRNPVDQGDWYVGNVASRGTFMEPFSPSNLVNLTISPEGGHWDVNATCDPNGNNNSSCALTQDQWEYRIFGGEISLNAVNDPQANNITGPLTSEDPLTGSEPITFSATDEGPGLAYVKMIVDGNVVQSEIMDSNDGRCLPIPETNPYTWAYQVPCKTSLGGRTYSLNTAQLPNGEHHIQVVIEDAAGNQSVVLDRRVEIENATEGGPRPAAVRSTEVVASRQRASSARPTEPARAKRRSCAWRDRHTSHGRSTTAGSRSGVSSRARAGRPSAARAWTSMSRHRTARSRPPSAMPRPHRTAASRSTSRRGPRG